MKSLLPFLFLVAVPLFALSQLNNNIFSHGPGDGHAVASFIPPTLSANNGIFRHSAGDGFAAVKTTQVSGLPNNAIFRHAAGDGFAYALNIYAPKPLNNSIFRHGAGDGFSIAAFPIANVLTTISAMNNVTREMPAVEETLILIYPNPSSGRIAIRLNANESKEMVILNAAGEIVTRGTVYPDVNEYDLTGLAKGIYVVLIGPGVVVARVVLF